MATSFKKPIQDCYEALGIPTDASTKDINSAYKKLALRFHPDKISGNDASNDEFQKIHEAVEILRDPVRRLKHDQELSRFRHISRQVHVEYEEPVEYDPFYNGWRHYSQYTADERYMYSYGNSVHMNPNSRESQEEKERVKNEMKTGEEMQMRMEEELREAKQRAEEEVLKEARRRMAMKARVTIDEELMAEGAGSSSDFQDGDWEEEALPDYGMYSDHEGESGYEDDQTEFDLEEGYVQHHYHFGYPGYNDEGPAEDEKVEEDLLSFEENDQQPGEVEHKDSKTDKDEECYEEQDNDDDDDGVSSNQSTQRTATEYSPPHRERDDPSPFNFASNQSKLSDSHYETTQEERSEDDPFYYSFSEDTQSAKSEDTAGFYQEQTAEGKNYIKVGSDLHSLIAPFLPLFEVKLNHPSGCYTRNDMHSELRGIVFETFCGWLESLRLGFSEAQCDDTAGDVRHTSQAETCEHLGYWTKEYGHDECESCHRWKPIYTLTCPGCGLKACVVCKFRS